MAFKPIRMSDSTTCISPFDPSVDHDKSDFEAYGKEMVRNPASWRDHIKAKDGETLTEFVIGVIPSDELSRIHDECKVGKGDGNLHDEELRWRCFLAGVRDIKGWSSDVPKKSVAGVEYVDSKWLRDNFIRGLRKVALSVGSLVWSYNQLTDDDVR